MEMFQSTNKYCNLIYLHIETSLLSLPQHVLFTNAACPDLCSERLRNDWTALKQLSPDAIIVHVYYIARCPLLQFQEECNQFV